MIESYKRFWNNILVFDGKSNRKDYWLPWIINIILGSIIAAVIQSITGHPIEDIYNFSDLSIASIRNIVAFLIWLATFSLKVRRLHDTDRSGWWILIEFVPFIGTIWFFILMVLPGKTNTRWN